MTKLLLVALMSAGLLVQPGISLAASNAFLLIQGLKGESKMAGRVDWTDIESATWAHGLPPSGTTTTAKGAIFQPLSVTKFTDSISPALAMAAASGQPFPTAVVELTRIGDVNNHVVFLRLELFDVRVVSYLAAASVHAELPKESLQLSYSRIRWTAYKIGPDRKQLQPPFMGSWDLTKNMP
jgi:type VI secretion system secreted protein Hcp